ncbi:MAG: UvrD-helicase domain-containing protein [Nitrospira sp.]|nr:UvrD-helicase domain-containing protein [Nitrospira sp.]MDE0487177.1 UvrD-helicase domain-containing protein [Nitrospira sp.]
MNVETNRWLEGLNDRQREAVLAGDGPVLVVAGPGTGKTKTLTVRLAYLLAERHVAPEALLAVTFTTRAAREMRERLARLIGSQADRVFLGTFHSFCFQLLKAEGHRLDLPPDFGVADRRDQITIMQRALRRLGQPDTRTATQRKLHEVIAFRHRQATIEPPVDDAGLAEIAEAYQRQLRQCGLLDFDELLFLLVRLLEGYADVRESLRQRYAHVLVDEYQDVDPVQQQLLRFLAGDRNRLWAVGDCDQAIYAFRGAESEHLLRFEQYFPNGRVITLEQSYRFTTQIAAVASQVIRRNASRRPLTLNAANASGVPVHVVSFPDERAEAAWIVGQIEESVGGTSHYQQYKGKVTDTVSQREQSFRDVAVLSRLHALTKPLQEALKNSGIPHRVVGEARFFDKSIVKDVLAYLRVIHNPHDDSSFARVLNCPSRGIGNQTQAALEAKAEQRGLSLYAVLGQSSVLSSSQMKAVKLLMTLMEDVQRNKAEQSLAQFIAHVADVTGLRQWRIDHDPRHEDDLLLLRSIAAKYDGVPTGTALEQFLEEASLAVEVDDYDASIDAVSLMTIHAAKGLEFPEVMLCGVEEGNLPREKADLEEERRLFYVGLTRAKERVWLLNCRNRFLFGERRDREPSRFLQEFDDSLKETTIMPDRPRRSKPEPEPGQLSLLG